MLYRTTVQTPIGALRIVASDQGVREILLPLPGKTAPSAKDQSDHPVLTRTAAQLDEYFRGERRDFDVPLDIEGTPFQRQVWDALVTIPYGVTESYAELAERVGRPGAARAVGGANGRNPVPIVVPCHRVINASGTLGGYGGPGDEGLAMKRALLDLEAGRSALQL